MALPGTSNNFISVEVIANSEIEAAAEFIRSKTRYKDISLGIVCGTGLSPLANAIEDGDTIPYEGVPGFPEITSWMKENLADKDHKGQMTIGKIGSRTVLCLQGRFHVYEGYTPQRVAFPIRVLKTLGADTVIITSAVGGINMAFRMGDFMLIRDHIYAGGLAINPLVGPNNEKFGPRYPQLDCVYSRELHNIAREVAVNQSLDTRVREGIYYGITGPMFGTYAELGAIAKLGGDAIGMSVCPEVCVAGHCGLKVLAISLITDAIAQYDVHNVSGDLVAAQAKINAEVFSSYVAEIVRRL